MILERDHFFSFFMALFWNAGAFEIVQVVKIADAPKIVEGGQFSLDRLLYLFGRANEFGDCVQIAERFVDALG